MTALQIPDKWGLTNLTIHFDEVATDPEPFAATAILQLRSDAQPGAEPRAVRQADEAILGASIPNLEVLSSGELQVGSTKLEHIETKFVSEGKSLHQLMLYVSSGQHLYLLTGTHLDGMFEKIRADVLGLAAIL